MSRTKQEYRLRTIGDVYYYKLSTMNTFKSTGCRTKAKAISFVLDLINKKKTDTKDKDGLTEATFNYYA